MNDKEKHITQKLEQLGAVEQDPARADACIDRLRQRLKTRPQAARLHPQLTFKFAAGILIAVGLLLAFGPFFKPTAAVAWADVVDRFNAIAFFNASVYIKENATDEPVQIEIWRNSLKKGRIRVDSQVLFADGGEVTAGFAIDGTLRKIDIPEYNEMGMAMARKLFSFEDFSLDTVLAAFGADLDRLQDTTPLINPAAMISEDLLVFDLESTVSPEWMRIWVLRESRLPVRIRTWDPRYGDCVDIVMSYSAEQSPEFFDPEAYEQFLLNVQQGSAAGGRANLAYALLEDPGQKDYTPQDLFEKEKAENVKNAPDADDVSGYHLPVVEQAGVTEYGAVWVVAAKAENRRPDGYTFFGFSDISDNLGRKYSKTHSIHRVHGDVSVNVFVPEDYPLDPTRPAELTLRCAVEATGPYQKEILIGTVPLENWQQNVLWPQDLLNNSELSTILLQARRKTDDRAVCEDILELVETLDTDQSCTHALDKIRLQMLLTEQHYADAARMADTLLPAAIETFKTAKAGAAYYDFFDYIVAFAGSGDIQRAADLFRELKQLKPDLSMYPVSTQKHLLERLARQVDGSQMHNLIQPLFTAGLDIEQVNKIAGFDVLEHEDTKWLVPQHLRRQRDPRVIKQQAYMQKLTERFTAEPLAPGEMVFGPCPLEELGYAGPVRDVKDHYFYIFNRPLHEFLKSYKARDLDGRTSRIQIEAGIENSLLQHEIIYNGKGFQWDPCIEFVLQQYGLEAIETEELQTVLIAEYDGRPMKDYRDVRCPAVRGSTTTPGMMAFMSSRGISLKSVLAQLARDQEIMLINNTRLDEDSIITREMANFKTEKGMELATGWFRDNFGITFRTEQRRLPVWIIRKSE